MLAASGYRPNCLFVCRGATANIVGPRVLALLGAAPLRQINLPGPLTLPKDKGGSLLLNDVAALRLDQQIALYDWLSTKGRGVQVLSVTAAPIEERVSRGEFLEGLYYRLNVVRVDVAPES